MNIAKLAIQLATNASDAIAGFRQAGKAAGGWAADTAAGASGTQASLDRVHPPRITIPTPKVPSVPRLPAQEVTTRMLEPRVPKVPEVTVPTRMIEPAVPRLPP